MHTLNKLTKYALTAWHSPDRRPPWAWCEEHIPAIPYSPMPGRFRSDNSPWLRAVMEAIVDAYIRTTAERPRYSSGILNSFGHPVPRVAGQLQETGSKARAESVRTEFTPEQDLWEIDLTSAYNVPGLERLTRTFILDRQGEGTLTIIDTVRFDTPQAFDSTIILDSRDQSVRLLSPLWEQDGKPLQAARSQQQIKAKEIVGLTSEATETIELDIFWGNGTVKAKVSADGALLRLRAEAIEGLVLSSPSRGTRLGFELVAPTREATITTVLRP